MIHSNSGLAADQLKQIIQKIERLEEEKSNLLIDIKEVYSEAKSNGFDSKIIRQLIRIRKMDQSKLEEQEELIELYKRALGMSNAIDDED